MKPAPKPPDNGAHPTPHHEVSHPACARARAMPNARLLVIKGAGHIPQIEQPDIFFDAVETFLKGGWAPEARKVQSPAGK